MNELKGEVVNIVLSVEEGRGFDFLINSVLVVANLSGRVIEADFVPADPNPVFATELVWQTTKQEIRKLRTSNIPLRVECYSLNEDQSRERIGCILLNMRSAQIIPVPNTLDARVQWHKLLGVSRDKSKFHPELKLSLTLQNRDQTSTRPVLKNENAGIINSMPSLTKEQLHVPFTYSDDGYIQIGNGENMEIFQLELYIKSIFNLHLLSSDDLESENNCYLSFSLFGLNLKTKDINNVCDSVDVEEKLVLQLKTNLNTLSTYFGQQGKLFLTIFSGTNPLASSEICLNNFVPNISFNEFVRNKNGKINLNKNYYFLPLEKVCVEDGEQRPFVQVEISLRILNSVTDVPENICKLVEKDSDKEMCITQHAEVLLGSGDYSHVGMTLEVLKSEPSSNESETTLMPKESRSDISFENGSKTEYVFLQSMPSFGKDTVSSQENEFDEQTYHHYALDIKLDSIMWKKQFTNTEFKIKFHHPKASTILVVQCNIDTAIDKIIVLKDINCRTHFVSTQKHIQSIVCAWPPKVSLCDSYDMLISPEFNINTGKLLNKDENHCQYSVFLSDLNTNEDVCQIKILMHLRNRSLNSDSLQYCLLEPIILDEQLVISEIEKLEEWKEQQKLEFEDQIKRLEKKRLTELCAKWAQRRNEIEGKLRSNMEKCHVLAEELQRTALDIRIQRRLQNGDSRKIQAEMLKTEFRNNEEKLNKAVETLRNDNKSLNNKICKLEQENMLLRNDFFEYSEELKIIKNTSLTNEQTANLLQKVRTLEEKFSGAQTAKAFFREQWKEAVREIHSLESDRVKKIRNHIHIQKEALSQLTVDGLTGQPKDDEELLEKMALHGTQGQFHSLESYSLSTPNVNCHRCE